MPHDGWRQFLPFLIDSYKAGKGTVYNEGLVVWSRKHPKAACTDGLTTANTASQLLYEFSPLEVVQGKLVFSLASLDFSSEKIEAFFFFCPTVVVPHFK